MSTKKIKFDFFSIEAPDNTDIVQAIDNTVPGNIGYPVKYKGNYVRFENYRCQGTLRIGCVSKLNMDDLPSKARVTQPGVEPLNLADDEGVASLTSFVISPQFNVLVLQRNFQGVRAGSFVHLLESLTNISGIGLNLIFEVDALQKLNRMNYFSKYILKIANPSSPEDYREVSVKEAAKLARYFDARTVKFELGIGPGPSKGFLAINSVKESIIKILKIADTDNLNLESLIIRGKEFDDEKMSTLDLLKQRLVYEADVPFLNRTIPPTELERAAWEAFEKKEMDLARYKPL